VWAEGQTNEQISEQVSRRTRKQIVQIVHVPLALEGHNVVAPRGEKLGLKSTLANE